MKRIIASFLVLALLMSGSGMSHVSLIFAQEGESVVEATESADTADEEDQEEKIETVNSYELFWPIVAGRTMGDSLFFLKSLKEKIRELLIFSVFKKADYNIDLSEKRVVEAEKLFLESDDTGNAEKSLLAAQDKRMRAFDLIKKAGEEGRYTTDLVNALKGSLEKQRALLDYVATQVGDEAKSAIESNISELNSLLAELE